MIERGNEIRNEINDENDPTALGQSPILPRTDVPPTRGTAAVMTPSAAPSHPATLLFLQCHDDAHVR